MKTNNLYNPNLVVNEKEKTALIDLEIKNKWKKLYLEEMMEKERNKKQQVIYNY